MSKFVLLELEESIKAKDPDRLEEALNQAWHFGMKTEYVEALNRMLALTWHFRHEDIVNALQKLNSSSSVEVLHQTALIEFGYLDYDEERGLSRKCIWALADIGNSKAKEALIQLSENSDGRISNYASKRLNNWDDELHRKGVPGV